MVAERGSMGIPHYCPHSPACDWSFVGSLKRFEGYLETHIRVVHKGVAEPVAGKAEEVPAPAAKPFRRANGRVTREEAIAAIQKIAERSGRAEAEVAPAPVEALPEPPEPAPAARDLEPVLGAGDDDPAVTGAAIEVAARPDDPDHSGNIPESPGEALEELEAVGERTESGTAPSRGEPERAPSSSNAWDLGLALTGDFARGAYRVRHEAARLRQQADALDAIAAGIDQLAETAGL